MEAVAAEQRISAPQPLVEMTGAAAELWNDQEDFEFFFNGLSLEISYPDTDGSAANTPSCFTNVQIHVGISNPPERINSMPLPFPTTPGSSRWSKRSVPLVR